MRISSPSTLSDLLSIMPLIILWIVAMAVLLLDVTIFKEKKKSHVTVSVLGIFLALVLQVKNRFDFGVLDQSPFGGAIRTDFLAGVGAIAVLVAGVLSVLLASSYLENHKLQYGEYYALVLFACSGAVLMTMANDLIVLFLGLEIMSFALYVLAAFARTNERSDEAGIKYFLLGAFASAFFLYGIALIYGALQTTNFEQIARSVTVGVAPSGMLLAGLGLCLVGLGFKAGLVPFHQWAPDVYDGSPTPATAFMAAVAKIGAVVAILRLMESLIPIHDAWLPTVRILAVLTMFVGNLMAINQTNIKRLLAYSGIAHAGYLMVAVAALGHSRSSIVDPIRNSAISGSMFYLFAYTFMTLGAFGVLIYLSNGDHEYRNIMDLKGLTRKKPVLAWTMVIFMLSLGGIPPTMGFVGKVQIFMAAVNAQEYVLAVLMGLASIPAIYYYLKVVYYMAFEEPSSGDVPVTPQSKGVTFTLGFTVVCTLLFGVLPFLLSTALNGLNLSH